MFETNKPQTIDLYARVSSDDQQERGTIATQIDFFRRWCDLHGYTVGTIYSDESVSGTIPLPLRPAGAQLLAAAKNNTAAPNLAIYRLDRIGRDPKIVLDAISALEKSGIVVRSLTEPFDTVTPAGRLMITMLAGFAGFERESILARSRDGVRRAARDGVWTGPNHCPYGYAIVGQRRNRRLEISNVFVPEFGGTESDVIKWIFWQVSAGVSAHEVTERLNLLNVPCPGYRHEATRKVHPVRQWSKCSVSKLVHHPLYKGVRVFNDPRWKHNADGSEFEIHLPDLALVPANVWDKAQAALKKNQRLATKNAKRKYLLRGLIYCQHCGYAYTGCPGNGPETGVLGPFYRCNGRNERKSNCNGMRVLQSIEDVVWDEIKTFLLDPAATAAYIEQSATAALPQPHDASEIARLQRALADKENERERIITAFRKTLITETDLDAQLETLRQEKEQIEAALKISHDRDAAKEEARRIAREAQTLIKQISEQIAGDKTPSWETKRGLVERLVERITVRTDEPAIKPEKYERGGRLGREVTVTIYYRFGNPAAALTREKTLQ